MAIDLLAFLNDDVQVHDSGDTVLTTPVETTEDNPTPAEGWNTIDDGVEDIDHTNDLETETNNEPENLGTTEPEQTENENEGNITTEETEITESTTPTKNSESQEEDPNQDIELDLNKTFTFMKDLNLLDVDDDYEFDGTPESAEKAIHQTLDNMRKSAQRSLMDTLSPEWREALTFALAKGGQGSIDEYLKDVSATNISDLNSLSVDNIDDQKHIIRAYQKETTKHSDQKINKYISILEENDMLEGEAKESLTELMNIRQLKKQEKNREYMEAIENRDKAKREIRKKFESIIDDAEYIESPRKNRLKAFINNERQAKGSAPTTGFERAISQIMANQEHLVQLSDLVESLYDSKKGFDYDRLTKKKASAEASNIRQKLDKYLTQPDGSRSKIAGPAGSGFNWEQWVNQN